MQLTVIQGGGDKLSRFYTCSICGCRDKWGPTWAWYGSYAQLEEWGMDKCILVCSAECQEKHEKERRR